jgi:hypothetical protein
MAGPASSQELDFVRRQALIELTAVLGGLDETQLLITAVLRFDSQGVATSARAIEALGVNHALDLSRVDETYRAVRDAVVRLDAEGRSAWPGRIALPLPDHGVPPAATSEQPASGRDQIRWPSPAECRSKLTYPR